MEAGAPSVLFPDLTCLKCVATVLVGLLAWPPFSQSHFSLPTFFFSPSIPDTFNSCQSSTMGRINTQLMMMVVNVLWTGDNFSASVLLNRKNAAHRNCVKSEVCVFPRNWCHVVLPQTTMLVKTESTTSLPVAAKQCLNCFKWRFNVQSAKSWLSQTQLSGWLLTG